nr:unnamed protein product [Digitaria exilis]
MTRLLASRVSRWAKLEPIERPPDSDVETLINPNRAFCLIIGHGEQAGGGRAARFRSSHANVPRVCVHGEASTWNSSHQTCVQAAKKLPRAKGRQQAGCLPPSHLHHPTEVPSHPSMGRSPCCDENGLKKGPWTPEEDQKLMEYIQKHGHGSWRALPKLAAPHVSPPLSWAN